MFRQSWIYININNEKCLHCLNFVYKKQIATIHVVIQHNCQNITEKSMYEDFLST